MRTSKSCAVGRPYLARAIYRAKSGRSFEVRVYWVGPTRFGRRARVGFPEKPPKDDFWVDEERVTLLEEILTEEDVARENRNSRDWNDDNDNF